MTVVSQGRRPLLSLRSTLIIVVAFIAALIAGVLAYLNGSSLPGAVIYGGGTFFAVLVAANSLIE